MSNLNFRTLPFNSSDDEFELLYELENTLDYHVKDWGSPSMIKYHANLIPEKCNALCEFIEIEGKIVGYGYMGHDYWAFDESLLDSNLAIPSEDRYFESAQSYLKQQIARARQTEGVKTLRAEFKESDFMKELYTANGFEVTLTDFVSIIELDDFNRERFSKQTQQFNNSNFRVETLTQLQRSEVDWQRKLFSLWHSVEEDVPTDLIEPNMDFELWKSSLFAPWFESDDIYIVLDGDQWVALSSYDRSDKPTDTLSTDLTGVLPEHRRKGICTALKVIALEDLKSKGYKKVFTDNEENNPMFQINLQLGFKKIGSEIGCQLKLL